MSSVASRGPEHPFGYQRRDWRVVDYHPWQLTTDDGRYWLRGPRPRLRRSEYIACVGAAQTFGCLCVNAWPNLLADALGFDTLNLGIGGAGPALFIRDDKLMRMINRSRFAVVQVLSGRSVDNSRFSSDGHEHLTRVRDGVRLGADAAWDEVLREGAFLSFNLLGRTVHLGADTRALRLLVAETRRQWIADTRQLLEMITVPTLLLYFSRRDPDYRPGTSTVHRLLGQFPQLVTGQMIAEISKHADRLVLCVSRRGSPHRLYNRFSGSPTTITLSDNRRDLVGVWRHNHYYPSPEMHEDAASALIPSCHKLLQTGFVD